MTTTQTATTNKARCFIFDRCKQDASTAAEYGEIKYVFPDHYGRPSVWSADFKHTVIEAMENLHYDPDTDYIIVIGHQIPVIVGISALVAYYGEIKALMFYPPEQKYRPVTLGGEFADESGHE